MTHLHSTSQLQDQEVVRGQIPAGSSGTGVKPGGAEAYPGSCNADRGLPIPGFAQGGSVTTVCIFVPLFSEYSSFDGAASLRPK